MVLQDASVVPFGACLSDWRMLVLSIAPNETTPVVKKAGEVLSIIHDVSRVSFEHFLPSKTLF